MAYISTNSYIFNPNDTRDINRQTDVFLSCLSSINEGDQIYIYANKLTSTEMGFAARFLFYCPRRTKLIVSNFLPKKEKEKKNKNMRSILINKQTTALVLNPIIFYLTNRQIIFTVYVLIFIF